MPLARQRGERLAPVHNTHSQSHLAAIGTKSAYKTNRDGVAERVAEPAVPKSIAVDRALLTYDDALLRDVALPSGKTAKHHDAHTRYLLQTVPGIGKSLRRVLLDDIHQRDRFPRGQDCASSCRLVKGAQASAGKRSGTSGPTSGHAPLTGAFSAAAVFCLRDHPAGQQGLTRVEKKPRQGKAWTLFAHTWARAVSDRFKNKTACAMATFVNGSGRGVGELAASLDHAGMPLTIHALPGTHTCVAERR
jgi:hypothetical protein